MHQVARVLEFQLQQYPSNEYLGLIYTKGRYILHFDTLIIVLFIVLEGDKYSVKRKPCDGYVMHRDWSVGYNFKMKIKVGITKKGTLEPVLGGSAIRKSGEIFSRQMEFRGKCPMQRCHVPRTRIPLPQPLTPYDLKGRNYQESRK